MEQKCDRLYPSAPLENIDLEQRLEKKINDVNSFINSINNIKEMITYFKDKNNKSKKITENSIHNIRICRLNRYHRSKVNFYKSFDYRCWYDYFTNISWSCLYSILR